MKAILMFLKALFTPPEKSPKENKTLEEIKRDTLDVNTALYERENLTTKKEESMPSTNPVEFKYSRLEEEYKELTKRNLTLKALIEDLNIFVNREFKKSLTITMIFRTQSEQDYLYRNSEKYKKKKFSSPHQYWHAVDIRSRDFSESQIKQIECYINEKWNSKNYYKWTALNHEVSDGIHFHIQFIKK